ncbi:DUF4838 domain-containing protein [Paenibacillus eucommiae]|uniref:Ribosomal silencing factor RsfS n=1 Tax=Paenibacillus eucommiae TaxID=1355755 RepID=A0ABS4IZZ9_9BACL|nr:DUF4838 domain-containing protein [Paenibacillus eucommiae]MBP1992426.1 ribosomal silencing factor RsfS [Paenibacillus eucommiae]
MIRIIDRRLLCCLLVLSLLCSLITPSISAADSLPDNSGTQTDLSGHWSQPVMEKWIQLGLLSGYSSGQYFPDRTITRSEFVTLIDRVFNFPEYAKLDDQPFKDVSADAWYFGAVLRAYHAGVIEGVVGNKFTPLALLTREDATVMVARAFQMKVSDEGTSAFADAPQISSYARPAVGLMQKQGYVKGNAGGLFKPKASITRSEAVQMMDNVTGMLVRANEVLNESAKGNVIIQGGSTTLSDMVVAGDLYITQGADDGGISLTGVTVKGNVFIYGGGRLELLDTTIGGLIHVNKSNADIEIVAAGSSHIPKIELLTGAALKEQQLAEGYEGFGDVAIGGGAQSVPIKIFLQGQFKQVYNSLKGVKLAIAEITTVARLTLDEAADVSVDGLILTAELNKSGSTLSKWPAKVKFGTSVTATIEGKLVVQERQVEDTVKGVISSGTYPEPEPETNGPLPVVENNLAKASVIVSDTADLQTREAADKLIRYVKQSTGVELPLVVDNNTTEKLIASNGSLQYEPIERLELPPTVADFKVQAVIDGIETLAYSPLEVIWNEAANTGKLIIHSLENLNKEQAVQYKVTYKDRDPIHSTILTIPGNSQGALSVNGSFEIGYAGDADAKPWRYFYEWAGQMSRSNEQARSGGYSLKAAGITGIAWPNQLITFAEPGQYELSAYIYVPAGAAASGTAQLFANLGGDGGEMNTRGAVVAASSSGGEWKKLSLELIVPEAIVGNEIMFGLELLGFAANESVYIDDVKLIRTDAGEELEEQEQTGTMEPADLGTGTQIYIGMQGLTTPEHQLLLEGVDSDGFVIHPNGNRITIAGPTSWGTEFGVDEFLERYIGVRWLMPGPDWEDVPVHDNLSVLLQDTIREEPAFFSRSFETVGNAARTRWMRDMRMNFKVEFAHNLYNLLPPSKYLESHPQFYPEGADLSLDHTWQPCFKAEGIVEESIEVINAYFDQHPEATSYSIGINDTTQFCKEDYGDNVTYNSLGMVDMSNIFFDWVNEVSIGVFEEHPDKYLGTYAYFNVYDPPTNVELDPRVVVFITDDRLSWGDPDMRQLGHTLSEGWAETGATVAFYDYVYGAPYVAPRNAYQLMEDQYRYAESIGVNAYFSELFPNFGEGPKPYLSAKLQWDPGLDKDTILEEWYERAVGAAAAADVKAYYEIWQRFWEEDIYETQWYLAWKNSTQRTNFLPLYSAAYLSDLKLEDLEESRRLLESAISKTETPAQEKRARDLLHMFEYYEISKASYVDQGIVVADPTSDAEAQAILDHAVEKIELMNSRYAMVDGFNTDDVYLQTLQPLKWEVVSNNEIWALARWISQNPDSEIHNQLEQWKDSPVPEIQQLAYKITTASYGAGVRNPGFEEGLTSWYDFPDTVAELVDDAAAGSKAIRVNRSSVEQTVFVESGKQYELSFDAKVEGNAGVLNLVGMNFWNVPGIGLTGSRITVIPQTYTRIKIRFTPPAGFSHATIVIYKDPGDGWVYADNFQLKEWSEADEIQLTGVTGTNGSIVAAFDGVPANVPVAQDFIVQPIINGIAADDMLVNQLMWDEETQTVTLSVPVIAAAAVEQQIVYKVTYDDGEAKDSPAIVISADPTASLLLNTSFEIGYAGDVDAKPWRYMYEWVGEMSRSNEQARSGSSSLKATGITGIAWPNQLITFAEPGQYELSAHIYAPAGAEASGTAQLFANLGGELNTRGVVVAASSSNGEWKKLSLKLNVPETIVGNEIMVGLELLGFGANESLYMDDIEMVKVWEPLNENFSFEIEAQGDVDAKAWRYFYDDWVGAMSRSNEQARSGSYSLKAAGITGIAWPNQLITFAEPGQYELSAYIYAPAGTAASGTAQLFANLGGELNTKGAVVAASSSNGEWKKLNLELTVPEAIVGDEIMFGLELIGIDTNETLFIDDVKIMKR